jgi:hypothetical protein
MALGSGISGFFRNFCPVPKRQFRETSLFHSFYSFMSHRRIHALSFLTVTAIFSGVSPAEASEPGWLPVVVARGEQREQIQSLPIEDRPYRPLHFYGNTVRRMHYRGTPLPSPAGLRAVPVRPTLR